MMKQFLLSILLVASAALGAQNQLVTTSEQVGDSTRKAAPWKFSGIYSASITQTSLTNWAAGGNNNVNVNGLFKQLAVYSKNKWVWTNLLEANFGYNFQKDYDVKTDDRIEFTTRLDRELWSEAWRLSLFANMKTQFVQGFSKPEDTVRISTFMAPGYLTYGLGLTFKSKHFSAYFSPAQIKNTFVLDDRLFTGNQFFNTASPNVGLLSKGGMRTEFGAYLDLIYKQVVNERFEFASRLNLFSNYLDRPQNIDVNWETILLMKVHSMLTVSLQVHLIYDNDVLVQNPNAEGTFQSPGLQVKQILGVGLAYSFGELKK